METFDMAEATTSSTSSQPASKQYIKASVEDNALEPDALRGNEKLIADLKIQDDEADRRKIYTNPKAS
jgi:hypothetical protein